MVLGSQGRGCDQWDIWAAVFGPQDPKTGYPKPLYDKATGVIDPTVAEYWKEHFDLSYIIERDWDKGLGEKVAGKLHIYCGTMVRRGQKRLSNKNRQIFPVFVPSDATR